MGINLSKKTISLDLQNQGFIQTIYVQENDSSDVRELTIYIYDDGNQYQIDTNSQIKLVGTRSDGKIVMRYIGKDEGESITNNAIVLRFRNEEICCKGISKYKIEFYERENGKTLSSFPFRLVVDKNSYDKNGLMATPVIDEIKELEDAIENAESQRVTAENARVRAETARGNNETSRNTAENKRATEEKKRISAENARVQAENTRIQSENARVSAENARVKAESKRETSENERIQTENDRKQAENVRSQSENVRVSAENTRKQTENSRVQSENNRIESENTRVTAENTRVAAENDRVEQEKIRQEDNKIIKSIVKEANTLIESVGISEENASKSATAASQKADEASEYSNLSKSYAVGTGGQSREGDDADCSKYYYEQAKSISESFAGALRPMGTVTFANLPSVSSATEGDMYNISDQFTTTADFKEEAGNVIPAGANVYRTADGKWDVLAGSPVTSVNGQRGNVSITPENIGAYSKEQGDALKKSVSDGKSSIASAITDQGVTTAADAAYATLATNITSVADKKYNVGKSDGVSETKKGNAIAANVLEGKTFTSLTAGVNATGTMKNYSGKAVPTDAVTADIQDIKSGQWSNSTGMGSTLRFKSNFSGYVDTDTTIGMNCYGLHPSVVKTGALIGGNGSPAAGALRGTYDTESSKPIAADKVLSGYIGFVNGAKITGAMTNRGAVSKNLNPGETYTIPAGYHNGSGKVINNVIKRIEYVGGIGPMIAFPNENYYAVRGDTQGNKFVNYEATITKAHSSMSKEITSYGTLVLKTSGTSSFRAEVPLSISAGEYVAKVKYACHSDSVSGKFRCMLNTSGGNIYGNTGYITNDKSFTYSSKEFKFISNSSVNLYPYFDLNDGKQGINIYGFDVWKIV